MRAGALPWGYGSAGASGISGNWDQTWSLGTCKPGGRGREVGDLYLSVTFKVLREWQEVILVISWPLGTMVPQPGVSPLGISAF